MIDRRDDVVVLIQKEIIEAPGSGADAANWEISLPNFVEAVFELSPETGDVPAEGFADSFRSVWKAMDLFD